MRPTDARNMQGLNLIDKNSSVRIYLAFMEKHWSASSYTGWTASMLRHVGKFLAAFQCETWGNVKEFVWDGCATQELNQLLTEAVILVISCKEKGKSMLLKYNNATFRYKEENMR